MSPLLTQLCVYVYVSSAHTIVCVCVCLLCSHYFECLCVCMQGSEWTWLVNNELVAKMEAIDRHLTECSKKLCLSSPARDGLYCVMVCVV